MAIIKNNNKAKAYKKINQLIKGQEIQPQTISARDKRFQKLQESRNVVLQERKPTVQKISQSPLNFDAKKELYETVKKIIIESEEKPPPDIESEEKPPPDIESEKKPPPDIESEENPPPDQHTCSLSRDAYYLNLFVLCCVDGIHDTNNENRFKSNFPGKTNFATTAPNFFRAVGDKIYKEFLNSYNNNEDNIDRETKKFFENISIDKKTYVTYNGDSVKDIEDYTILFLINYDNIDQTTGGVKYNGITTYNEIKNIYNRDYPDNNETNNLPDCDQKTPKRFCSQNGNEWGTNKNWSEILSLFGKEYKKKLEEQNAETTSMTFNYDNTFNKIDMGVTATLIDGLSGKIGNLTNVYNNSNSKLDGTNGGGNGTAPCIAVELGNMNARFNIVEEGIDSDHNFLEIKSRFIIAKKRDNEEKFDILNSSELKATNFDTQTDDIFGEDTNPNYKILYEIKLKRGTMFKTPPGYTESVATYLYELYPNLKAIKIAEEMKNENRGTYGVDSLRQEDTLGQHVTKFVQDNEYIPGDCIQIIRKAICDYFQSLQNLIVFGSNSIVKNDIDSSIKYFPNKNNIIKYEYDINNTSGFQIRTNTHRDRPAASLSGFLIKKLTSGRNEYYHTSYTSKGANFFFSNKGGIVLALFEPKNMISQVKKRKRVDESMVSEESTVGSTVGLSSGGALTPPTSTQNSPPPTPRPSSSPTNIGSRQGSPRTFIAPTEFSRISLTSGEGDSDSGISGTNLADQSKSEIIEDFFDLYSKYDEITHDLINFKFDDSECSYISSIVDNFTSYLHGIYDNYRMNYIGMHEYIITDNLILFTPYNQLYINNLIFFNKDTENESYILGLTENIKVCPDTDDFSELNNDENYPLQLYNYVENKFYTNLFDKIDNLSQENIKTILDNLNDDEITNSVNEIVSDDENKLIDGVDPGNLDEKIKTAIDNIVNKILGTETFPITSESETSLVSSIAPETERSSIGSEIDSVGTSDTETDIPPLMLPKGGSEEKLTGGSKLHKRTFKKMLRNNKKRKTIKHKKLIK